ncbi:hypothetical protein FRC03_003267 [Tulasnella sp. 419]|nr:hypothetical protein FRC03_003267 [Tulasnella sp. 419]
MTDWSMRHTTAIKYAAVQALRLGESLGNTSKYYISLQLNSRDHHGNGMRFVIGSIVVGLLEDLLRSDSHNPPWALQEYMDLMQSYRDAGSHVHIPLVILRYGPHCKLHIHTIGQFEMERRFLKLEPQVDRDVWEPELRKAVEDGNFSLLEKVWKVVTSADWEKD